MTPPVRFSVPVGVVNSRLDLERSSNPLSSRADRATALFSDREICLQTPRPAWWNAELLLKNCQDIIPAIRGHTPSGLEPKARDRATANTGAVGITIPRRPG